MTKPANAADENTTNENWAQDGDLIYSLKDGTNSYEINVSMVAGSRAICDRVEFAGKIKAMLEKESSNDKAN